MFVVEALSQLHMLPDVGLPSSKQQCVRYILDIPHHGILCTCLALFVEWRHCEEVHTAVIHMLKACVGGGGGMGGGGGRRGREGRKGEGERGGGRGRGGEDVHL